MYLVFKNYFNIIIGGNFSEGFCFKLNTDCHKPTVYLICCNELVNNIFFNLK